MSTLITIIVTFFAGMGAGLGTGFAGLSAAAVISPMLITFLGMDPYMAVGIALSSNDGHGFMLHGCRKLCIKPRAVSNNGQLFGIYDIFTRNQVYSPSCHDNKGGHAGSFS